MVKTFPKQMVPLFTLMIGKVFTVTAEIAVLEETQPTALVPVTEYVVLVAGDTTGEPLENV